MLLSKRLIVILFVFVNFAITCQVDQYKDNSEEKKSSVKALNILFILGHFPAASQIFILNIITNLIDRGHKVSIFSFHKDDYVNMHPNIEKYNLLDRVTYNKLCEPFPECDIVFCQFGYLGKTIVRMKKLREWLKNKKLVVCFRGSDITSYLTQDVEMYQKLFKRIDLALPVCDYFREKLITLGCNTDKIVTHHSAIDCREFFLKIRKKPEKSVIRIVSVGRLVKKKGIDYAIKAFAHIAQRYPQVHFTILGDGPERPALEELIQQLDLQEKVTLHGWATQEEVISILDTSHIFVLPSRTGPDGNEEGIANALKEAMAMGLVSVGTWHAGTPELIEDGVSGFLVHEKSVFQLSRTLEYIIEHPEIWKPVALAARKKIEAEFEIKHAVEQLEILFYQLLTNN